jgi:hydrogenase-4 component B
LLAYHSVENIGIILIGLGFAMLAKDYGLAVLGQLALAGCLLHVWNHGLFKALLFLAAGSVLHATGTREMSQLGGLWRKMPWTTALFALGAAAISGLPPLNGFVSEWLIYLGLFDAVNTHNTVALIAVPAVVLLAMTGALALACFVKACGVVFLGAPRSRSVEHAHECGWLMRGPMLLLAGACVAIGLAPVLFWPALARVVGVWQPAWVSPAASASLGLLSTLQSSVALLAVLASSWLYWRVTHNGLKRELTWDCGYAVPTARMQYTAGSFAATITEWFAWILRPQRHEERPEETFPSQAHFEEHTPETVLERVLGPMAMVTMMASAAIRRLQHGRLQSYLVYLLVGLIALTAMVMMGGGG